MCIRDRTHVMTFSVRYIGDQAFRFTQFFTDDFYDIDVFHLIVTTDVIYLSLIHILARILESYYRNMRPIQLFFYYPSDDYMACLIDVYKRQLYGLQKPLCQILLLLHHRSSNP